MLSKITCLTIFSLFIASEAYADDMFDGDMWFVANTMSHHLSEQKFNEKNYGLGLEYHFTDDVFVMAGKYKNSVDKKSAYALGAWTPLRFGRVGIGIAAGAVNGYPALNNGKVAPIAAGIIRVEDKHLGLNVIAVPKFKESPATIGLQLKWKF